MDNDLNRSLRILEDALSSNRKSLLRTTPKAPSRRQSEKPNPINLSLTLGADELHYLQQNESLFPAGATMYDETMHHIMNADRTLTGSAIRSTNEPWNNSTDSLFMEFMEVIQFKTGTPDVLEIVSDFARCCDDALQVLEGIKSKVNVNAKVNHEAWLRNERNTWRLLFCLYQNRLSTMDADLGPYTGRSEKMCVANLYKRDPLVRESQLVIDWLESIVSTDLPLHFSDKTVGWENTLHQLESPKNIVFASRHAIVSCLDPDAPLHENKRLHNLDEDNEKLLNKAMFRMIRAGKLDEAQQLCIHCGHPWKAALLEGWRLHHNPNDKCSQQMEDDEGISMDTGEKRRVIADVNVYEGKEVEGNQNRDIWKATAWEFSSSRDLDAYEKASIASYCGNLDAMLAVCTTWEDYLWAYIRTMVDIRVESEIRDFVSKKYQPMCERYWNNRMSLNEIFDRLAASKDMNIRQESTNSNYVIQKHIILDEIPQLIVNFEKWIEEDNVTDQFCRFLAHLVLFFKQIGCIDYEDIMDKVLECYINRLIKMNHTQLVAFYTGTLSQNLQVKLYASYIEKIDQYDERKEALRFAEEAGLYTKAIMKQVVENIRNKPDPDQQHFERNLQHKITEMDKFKISSLEWILFYESQRAEALYQVNALMLSYLTIGKIDAARLAFNKIPPDAIDIILTGSGTAEENHQKATGDFVEHHEQQVDNDGKLKIPQTKVGNWIRKFLCYKAYLDAHEAFSDWYKHFQSKPLPPNELPEGAQFTETVAHQHKVSKHKADMERWKIQLSHLAKHAKTLLYNIILFPEGWLCGCQNTKYLRESCIPEIVLLLFSVLYESSQHEEAVQLADILASERYRLYEVYSKEKLQEILLKLSESSVALLNEKKDPWGNPSSA